MLEAYACFTAIGDTHRVCPCRIAQRLDRQGAKSDTATAFNAEYADGALLADGNVNGLSSSAFWVLKAFHRSRAPSALRESVSPYTAGGWGTALATHPGHRYVCHAGPRQHTSESRAAWW